MVNKTAKYESELIEAINKFKWLRWEHIQWESLSFSRSTAYHHNLHESDTIKDALKEKRAAVVNYLIPKWIESDNATLNIAAFKIASDDEDRQRLNQQNVDHTTKGEKVNGINIFVDSEMNDEINRVSDRTD